MGYIELLRVLPLVINETSNITGIIKNMQRKKEKTVNFTKQNEKNIDFTDSSHETSSFLTSTRTNKHDQLYINKSILKSKTSKNISKSITNSLNSVTENLLKNVKTSNRYQASKENAVVRDAFNLSLKSGNLNQAGDENDFQNTFCTAHILNGRDES